jgi:glycosyltransferase involved in cell wall biosynthesis
MRICLIGDWRDPIDEGMKKTGHYFARYLSIRHDILKLSPFDAYKPLFWKKILDFRPEIIHYIGGPSSFTLVLIAILKIRLDSKIILSAIHPHRLIFPQLPRGIQPDLALVQSARTEQILQPYSIKTAWFPGGVNTKKFSPVSPEIKLRLRGKFSIPEEDFVVLHVGNLRKSRNLVSLTKLMQVKGIRGVVVGSSSLSRNKAVEQALREAGAILVTEYIENIEEMYRMADAYVFSVKEPHGAIEFPLSVLEAMSCNLPVLSTRFGALPDYFEDGEGVWFFDSDDELIEKAELLRVNQSDVQNSARAANIDWENLVERLEEIYRELI